MIVYGEKVYSINLFNTVVAEILFVFYSCSIYSSVRAASNIGLKQGCNLSPTLFNVFINDIPELFISKDCDPVYLGETKVNCSLYADDLVLLSLACVAGPKILPAANQAPHKIEGLPRRLFYHSPSLVYRRVLLSWNFMLKDGN